MPGAWLLPRGLGSASWSDHRALSIWKPVWPRAAEIEARMTLASASALAVPIWPLISIVASETFASRRCSAAGRALLPKLARATVTIVEASTASSRLASSSRDHLIRRRTNDARAPRARSR